MSKSIDSSAAPDPVSKLKYSEILDANTDAGLSLTPPNHNLLL